MTSIDAMSGAPPDVQWLREGAPPLGWVTALEQDLTLELQEVGIVRVGLSSASFVERFLGIAPR